MKGVGGVTALSLSGVPVASAEEVADAPPSDPHTRDTYRSLVDALVPRTPTLGEELGPEHVPGGLEVELERYLIWALNNSEEVRADATTATRASELEADLDEEDLQGIVDEVLAGRSTSVRTTFEALGLVDVDVAFGGLDALVVSVDVSAEAGPASIELRVETTEGSVERESANYPYAPVLAVAFDVAALEFVARGRNEDAPEFDERFPAGGAFARLSAGDRLRCLQWMLDGGAEDAPLSALPVVAEELGFVVTALQVLVMYGYYSEWAGYESPTTGSPNDWTLETPPEAVQSRRQTDYPGFRPGYDDHRGFELSTFRENDY